MSIRNNTSYPLLHVTITPSEENRVKISQIPTILKTVTTWGENLGHILALNSFASAIFSSFWRNANRVADGSENPSATAVLDVTMDATNHSVAAGDGEQRKEDLLKKMKTHQKNLLPLDIADLDAYLEILREFLATEEEVEKAISQNEIEEMFENEEKEAFIEKCLQLPKKIAYSLVCALCKNQEIQGETLRMLVPFLSELSPEQRLTFLLTEFTAEEEKLDSFSLIFSVLRNEENKGKRQSTPLFVRAAELDRQSQEQLTVGIKKGLLIKGLRLGVEDYLKISKEKYAERVQALQRLIHGNSEEDMELQQMLGWVDRQELRLLLQYLRPEEIKAIQTAQKSPHIDIVADLIAKGRWLDLLHTFKTQGHELSYLLLAAYCQKRIDLEDLATAMLFHRAFQNTKEGDCTILPISSDVLDTITNLSAQSKREILQATQELKENQKFLILVNKDSFDEYTQGVIQANFSGKNIVGFLERISTEKSEFGVLSFGINQAHYKNLAPILHLTPTTEIMADHILSGRSDFVLQFPEEVELVHGSVDRVFFAQIHDLFHAEARNTNPFQYQMTQKIQRIAFDPALRKAYREKMNAGIDALYPSFMELPTEEEMVAYLLDRIAGEVVDGGFETFHSIPATWKNLIEKIIKREFQHLNNSKFINTDQQNFQQNVIKKVTEKLFPI